MKRSRTTIHSECFPAEIRRLLDGADLYDSSCSPEARVWFADSGGGLFLKEAAGGELRNEAKMTAFFHERGLSSEVLYYGTEEGRDYMLTKRIPGEDCTDPKVLAEPERLCDTIAGLLRELHECNPSGCPVTDRIMTYREAVLRGADGKHYEPELFKGIWEFSSFDEAWKAATEGLPALRPEVLIHGDYCLPNIILDKWKFSGFIDLGNGGIGDRHIDLLWGIWTLNYNLRTTQFTDRFLDAYGRDMADAEKLRAVAAMEMVGEG